MRYFLWVYVLAIITVVSILGFRGDTSKNPPLEVFPDMDRQLKFLEQSENNLFSDRRSDRLPPVGSVVRGNALELGNVFSSDIDVGSVVLRTGKNPDGNFTSHIPSEVEINMALIRQGKEGYDIHCSNCHGRYGNGRGVTAQFGLLPKNLSDPSVKATYLEALQPWSDGQIYNAISNGSASQIMLGLADKLNPKERWAIVLYVRALQSYVGNARNQEVVE
jgi:mono/diheme cytochrome c family protein